MAASKRLTKEHKSLLENPPAGVKLSTTVFHPSQWQATIFGVPGSLYAGETFTLQFTFNDKYPFDSPEVVFVGTAPVHPHIYSNGHICLSVLDSDWFVPNPYGGWG